MSRTHVVLDGIVIFDIGEGQSAHEVMKEHRKEYRRYDMPDPTVREMDDLTQDDLDSVGFLIYPGVWLSRYDLDGYDDLIERHSFPSREQIDEITAFPAFLIPAWARIELDM